MLNEQKKTELYTLIRGLKAQGLKWKEVAKKVADLKIRNTHGNPYTEVNLVKFYQKCEADNKITKSRAAFREINEGLASKPSVPAIDKAVETVDLIKDIVNSNLKAKTKAKIFSSITWTL